MISLILDTAADILEADGWMANPRVGAWRDRSPKCVAYAIDASSRRLGWCDGLEKNRVTMQCVESCGKGNLDAVIDWSDKVCTSTAEAVAMLRAAAARVRETANAPQVVLA